MKKPKTKTNAKRKQTDAPVTPASQATGKGKTGLPSLALSAIKIAAFPGLGALSVGLGTLPTLADVNQPKAPDLKPSLPQSAGLNSLQAAQTPEPSAPNIQSQSPGTIGSTTPSTLDKDTVLAASTIATGFAAAASTIDMTDGDKDRFFDISQKLLNAVKAIEVAMIDEQDTAIVHAAQNQPTTIVQQPFMPTEAPVPQSNMLTSLLTLAGGLVAGVGTALTTAGEWMGALWTNYCVTLYNNVKNLIALGWSKVVTGFNTMSTWVTGCISTITKWVDTAVGTVTKWVSGAADTIKNLWNSFDLSKLNILDFDLKGLWAKLTDLSVFGDWGNAVKNALNIFGGSGLDTLKTVFDIAGKVWNFVKPVVKILGTVAKFMGPIGLLFGIASMASDIGTLISDAGAIVDAKTPEGKIAAGKTLLAHAMRTIAEAILPESMVDMVFNSNEQDAANTTAKESGIVEETGNIFGADYKIKNPAKLSTLDVSTLQNMLDSGDYSDDDEKILKMAIESKKGHETATSEDDSITKATETSSAPIPQSPAAEFKPADVPQISTEPLATQKTAPGTVDEAVEEIRPVLKANGVNDQEINQAVNNIKQQAQDGPQWEAQVAMAVKEHAVAMYNIQNSGTRDGGWVMEKQLEADEKIDQTLNEIWTSGATGLDYNSFMERVGQITQNVRDEYKGDISKLAADMSSNPSQPPDALDSAPVSSAAATPVIAENTVNIATPDPTVVISKPDPKAAENTSSEKSTANAGSGGSSAASAAADYATEHAHPKSTHYCARYVANSLEAAGYKFQRNGMAYQYVTNGTLQKMGFSQVDMNQQPQKGDISVIGPRTKGHAGHISIFNGKNWVSDFIQRNESPYAKLTPSQWMTRWRDTGNKQVDPEAMAKYAAAAENASAPSATAVPSENSGFMDAVLSAINTFLDPGGASNIGKQSDPASTTGVASNNAKKDTGMALDDMLMISNGFN